MGSNPIVVFALELVVNYKCIFACLFYPFFRKDECVTCSSAALNVAPQVIRSKLIYT